MPGLVDSHRLRVETALIENVNNVSVDRGMTDGASDEFVKRSIFAAITKPMS